MDKLLEWYQTLSPRDRKLALIAAAGVALLIVFAVLLPLDRGVARSHERLARKQADLAWMRSVTPQLRAIGPQLVQPGNTRSLIVVIDASAREAGLGSALTNSEPSGQGGLRVRLDKAPFDILVGWLARLADQNGVRVESANVDSAGAPGLVNAGIVLRSRQ